jgi:hypothetical protein
VRVFRIAIPASQIDLSRLFYESVLALDADDTVPSRLYFHCGDVIMALIDWTVEGRGPFHATPDDLYFATEELDRVHERALPPERVRSLRSRNARGASDRSTVSIQTATDSASSTRQRCFWAAVPPGRRHTWLRSLDRPRRSRAGSLGSILA